MPSCDVASIRSIRVAHPVTWLTLAVYVRPCGSGNLFGETEVLLGVPRFCTVVADSTEVRRCTCSLTPASPRGNPGLTAIGFGE